MKFTSELTALLWISTATALMWVPYVCARMAIFGVNAAIGHPGPDYPVDPPWADRARRAHLNAIENLAVFAPMVLIAGLVGVSTTATVCAAWVYVIARLLHYAIYTAGIPVLRTIAFLAGSCATLVIAAVLFLSAT
ncbi:MAPEG family protein [soil metagenome]